MSQVTNPEAFLQSRSKLLSRRRCWKRLDEIDTARRQLVLQLEDLDAQARAVQLELAALAPISSVPDEILAAIFEAGTFEGPKVVDPRFGYLVSHVARHWRRIALGTSQLWSTIACVNSDTPGDPKISPEQRREQVAAFLSRSQSLPVDIHLRHFAEEDFSEDLIQLIGAYMGQCRRLRITGAHLEGLSRAVQYLSTKSAPHLHTLELYSSHKKNMLQLQEPLFPLAPQLEVAQLDGFDMLTMHFCQPGLRSVRTLEITNVFIGDAPKWNAFRDTLMALPLLDHLELDVKFYATRERLPIVLPTVRLLHLDATSRPTFLPSVIHLIHAESLGTLSLAGWGSEDSGAEDTDVEPELHFPSLRHLVLVAVTRQRPALGAFARKFPDIERLTCYVSAQDPLCDVECIRTAIRRAQGMGGTEEDATILDADNGCPRWSKLQDIAVWPNSRPVHGLFSQYYLLAPELE